MSTATLEKPKTHAPHAETETYGLLAEFHDVDGLLHAARSVREAGFTKWESYTPFPVHGLDKAMGAKATILPFIVLGAGLTGMAIGIALQYWTNGVNYPYLISGKPYFSYPAYVPVAYELTILLSAFGAVFGMFGLNKLPQFYHSLFNSHRFKRVTQDRFFICIETADPKYHADRTAALLHELGAKHVEAVEK